MSGPICSTLGYFNITNGLRMHESRHDVIVGDMECEGCNRKSDLLRPDRTMTVQRHSQLATHSAVSLQNGDNGCLLTSVPCVIMYSGD